MTASVARHYHTLDNHYFSKHSGKKTCRCCPYGYHIDIDFVRYCEKIADSQLFPDKSIRKSRWNVRKQRASKETLLGISGFPTLDCDGTKASQEVGDDLQRAVMDFEQVLINSCGGRSQSTLKHKEWPASRGIAHSNIESKKFDAGSWTLASDSILSIQDLEDNIYLENNASPQLLQSIRKQMATSLGRMRELEDKVKFIPNLQAHILNLEKQNEKLKNLLSKSESLKINQPIKSIDVGTATNHTLHHTRNVGVGCSVMTRDIGIFCLINKNLSNTTSADKNGLKPDLPSSISLENIIKTSSKSYSKTVGTSTDRLLKSLTKNSATETDTEFSILDIVTAMKVSPVNKELKQSSKHSCTSGTLTELKLNDIYTQKDLDTLLQIHIQHLRSNEISKADFGVQTMSKQNETRNSFDVAIQTTSRRSKTKSSFDIAIQTMIRQSETKSSFDVAIQTLPKLIKTKNSFDVAIQTTAKRIETKNIFTQVSVAVIEVGVLSKVQTTDKGVQSIKKTHDTAVNCSSTNDYGFNGNLRTISTGTQCDKVISGIILQSQYSDTVDLTNVKDQGLNTINMNLVNTGTEACSLLKSSDSKRNSSNVMKQLTPTRPSYLPVPLTAAGNKSKIPRKSTDILRLKNDDYGSDSNSDDGVYNPRNDDSLSRIDSFSTFHPIQSKTYKTEPTKEMKGALKVLNDALQKYSRENFPKHMRNAINIVQQEWFKISSVAVANPLDVEDYVDCFEEISSTLLEYIVNMTDATGNTAMHYAVSNGNFDVVSILLDSKVCNINKINTAGYTCIMLVALSKVSSDTDREVVRRLFHMGDINIRAKQHGQTALMLAVSHGRIDTVELLLESGADINIQDEDGSTALMCAAEHGYIDIVKLLLAQPDCDLTITDYDGSTALAIAMEAGNRDIGVLLYAQEHFSRGGSPFTPTKNQRRAKSATPTLRGNTPTQSPHELPH